MSSANAETQPFSLGFTPGELLMKFARAAAVAAVAAAVMMVILAANPAVTTAQEKKEQGKKSGGKGKSWDESVDAAIAFLRTTQAEDGSWSKASHPGITGVVVTGLLKSGKVKADDPIV